MTQRQYNSGILQKSYHDFVSNHNDGIDKYLHDAVYPVIGFKSLSAELQNIGTLRNSMTAELQNIGMLGETTRGLNDRAMELFCE